ncbi:phage baseplate assembly protein [Microvirga terricola]|uniref:Bacteriophage Mu Gp45 N-terminal domain-containing protein n=1 Tax=Microvirga terricola TaxID=2719797 RepID=A0ABX0V8R2_9HYPH|nr:phage baseplate assembly protein [Microvirga terricola]NIX75381.1 hypothetical protein [Microvirga terricola]
MSDMETAHQIRGIVARAYVHAVNDNEESQTANVTVYQGVDRSDVEILQPFGFASRAPAGSLMVVFAVGGDQGDLVGFAPGAPFARLGKLEDGETAIYTLDGSRVHVKKDGSIEILSSKRVLAKVKDAEYEITEDMIRGRIGNERQPRFVVRPDYVKMRCEPHWLVVSKTGIFSSTAIVVSPDPEPNV